jgi:superfamily I DNA/RNA helicase|nr:ATP-dependent helicase [Mycolicibacterium iranicum]
MYPQPEASQLSRKQQQAVTHSSNFILKACPGSGKTQTTAARIARLMSDEIAVAACSYTNVGVDAVRNALKIQGQHVIQPLHFVGTLHGFLLRHVTYPFGHLLYGVTPRLLRDESSRWPVVDLSDTARRMVPLPLFRMRPDGSMRMTKVPQNVGLSIDAVLLRGSARARELKREMAQKGWVSSDDAMYVALRVLRGYPEIARAVAGRYGELIVDEAQDTNAVQLECLSLLKKSGALRSLVLVGDTDQAISSFAGATVDGCDRLAADCGLQSLDLDENFRSSQRICDLAHRFSSRPHPDLAVGRDASHAVDPEFLVYPVGDPARAVLAFMDRLSQLGEDSAESAILVRGNDFRDEINGSRNTVKVSSRSLAMGRAVAKLRGSHTLTRHDIESIDQIVALAAFGEAEFVDRSIDERISIRNASTKLLADAPSLDQDLQSWIRGVAALLTTVSRAVADQPMRSGGTVLRTSAAHAGYSAQASFQTSPQSMRAQTIHDIKGESRNAVLIILDRKPRNSRTNRLPQSDMWASQLRGLPVDPNDTEEVRIAFVALTRARRYCLVAVPDDSTEESISAFSNAGLISMPTA